MPGYRTPLRRIGTARPQMRTSRPAVKQPVAEAQRSPLDIASILVQGLEELRGMHQKFLEAAPNIPGLIEQHVSKIKQGPAGPPGRPGVGIDGKSPDMEEILTELLRRVQLPRDGKPGRHGRDGMSVSVEDVLLALQESGIDIRHVRGLEDELRRFGGYQMPVQRLGGGGDSIVAYDLSSQCTGSNKSFTLPKFSKIVQLTGSDAPFIYRPVVDYTAPSGMTITLAAGVNAPSSGATLIALYVA